MKKNSSNERHTLLKIDDAGFEQAVIFQPLGNGRVRVYFSEMGDDDFQSTEEARELYRRLKRKGWYER